METRVRCPECGRKAFVKSEPNPIRNTVRDTIKCTNCGFEKVRERPPSLTIGDWMAEGSERTA